MEKVRFMKRENFLSIFSQYGCFLHCIMYIKGLRKSLNGRVWEEKKEEERHTYKRLIEKFIRLPKDQVMLFTLIELIFKSYCQMEETTFEGMYIAFYLNSILKSIKGQSCKTECGINWSYNKSNRTYFFPEFFFKLIIGLFFILVGGYTFSSLVGAILRRQVTNIAWVI